MARPIWSGSVSFGIVSIPVQLFPAVPSNMTSISIRSSRAGTTVAFHYRKVVEGRTQRSGQG